MTNTTNNNATMIAALINNTPAINGIRYLAIPLSLLEVHPTIQRDRKGHERKIAAAWDDAKCGTILVSYRDNRLMIIDGQHRYWAAQICGHDSIPCAVIECKTEAEEALLFARQDENKVRLTSVEKVKALCVGNDGAALLLKAVCDDYRITLIPNGSTGAPRLKGIRAAQLTLQRFGETALRWAFDIIEKARWRDIPAAYGEDVIVALRQVYAKYGNDKDVSKAVIKALRGADYITVMTKARNTYTGFTASRAMAAYLSDAIDKAKTDEIVAAANFEVVA